MNQNKDNNNKEEPLKIVLIGESGVGKTSIIYQFIDRNFQEDQQTTIGGTFAAKKVKCSNGKILKLEIWDTAGQERFRSVTKIFYKDANAAILVYDITSKFSFEGLKNYWVKQVKESSDNNIILAIIANKSDLFEKEQIEKDVGKEYAKEINALFCSTSAKDNSSVDELFLEIAKKYSGADSVQIIEDKERAEGYKKIRKESIRITKQSQKKKKKKFC